MYVLKFNNVFNNECKFKNVLIKYTVYIIRVFSNLRLNIFFYLENN